MCNWTRYHRLSSSPWANILERIHLLGILDHWSGRKTITRCHAVQPHSADEQETTNGHPFQHTFASRIGNNTNVRWVTSKSSNYFGFVSSSFIIHQPHHFSWFLLETGSTASKLSTFSSTCGKSNVQMRRTTNKKGKTAPAPPKRTR